jgi:hypothetical protein
MLSEQRPKSGATTLSIMTFRITKLSIMTFRIDTQHDDIQHRHSA